MPLTKTSTALKPVGLALLIAFLTISVAAYGVDLLAPLKPKVPALLQEMTLPFKSVKVTKVLL